MDMTCIAGETQNCTEDIDLDKWSKDRSRIGGHTTHQPKMG